MGLLSKAKKAITSKLYWKTYSLFIDTTFEPRLSYSQNGEDIIVHSIFEALSRKTIFYLDAGGYHPFVGSNTALFYLTGSRGIIIEPNPALFPQFPLRRPRDICLNIGVSDRSGTQTFFLSRSGALGSLIPEEGPEVQGTENPGTEPVEIAVRTLPEVIEKYAEGNSIDFLSIDIEGMELPVLKMLDFEKYGPLVICAETIPHSSAIRKEKRSDIIDFLKDKGYFVYADTYINTIFVRNDVWK